MAMRSSTLATKNERSCRLMRAARAFNPATPSLSLTRRSTSVVPSGVRKLSASMFFSTRQRRTCSASRTRSSGSGIRGRAPRDQSRSTMAAQAPGSSDGTRSKSNVTREPPCSAAATPPTTTNSPPLSCSRFRISRYPSAISLQCRPVHGRAHLTNVRHPLAESPQAKHERLRCQRVYRCFRCAHASPVDFGHVRKGIPAPRTGPIVEANRRSKRRRTPRVLERHHDRTMRQAHFDVWLAFDAETGALVEAHGGLARVRHQADCAGLARPRQGKRHELLADALALELRCDGHLSQLPAAAAAVDQEQASDAPRVLERSQMNRLLVVGAGGLERNAEGLQENSLAQIESCLVVGATKLHTPNLHQRTLSPS